MVNSLKSGETMAKLLCLGIFFVVPYIFVYSLTKMTAQRRRISELKVSIQRPSSNNEGSKNEELYKMLLEQKDAIIKGKDDVIQILLKSKEETIKSKEENIQTVLKSKEETIASKEETIKSKEENIITLLKSKEENIQTVLKSKDEVITIMKISSDQIIAQLKTKILDLEGRLSMRCVMEDFEEIAPKQALSTKQSARDLAWNVIFEKNIRQINDHLQLQSSPSEEEKAHWVEIAKSLYRKLCKRLHKFSYTKVVIITDDLSDEETSLAEAICKATPVIFEVLKVQTEVD